jgi:uncharacterized membrane protein
VIVKRSPPRLLAALSLIALGACAVPDSRPAGDAPANGIRDRSFYVCPGDVVFSVDFMDDEARVTLGDRVVRLARYPDAADRYGDGALDLRVEDRAAWLSEGGEAVRCHAEGTGEVWRDAIRRGVVFRAMGQEPGWLVEIDAGGLMVVLLDYGTERIETAAPAPDRTARGTEYRTRTANRDIRVVIEDRPCRDVMSGEPFPSTVTLIVDGRTLDGCGIRLAQSPDAA